MGVRWRGEDEWGIGYERMVHIRYILGTHSVHIQCTFSAYSVHIQCTLSAHSVPIQCTFSAHSVHIQCILSPYLVHCYLFTRLYFYWSLDRKIITRGYEPAEFLRITLTITTTITIRPAPMIIYWYWHLTWCKSLFNFDICRLQIIIIWIYDFIHILNIFVTCIIWGL